MSDQNITKYLKLPFQFDAEHLEKDLSMALTRSWKPHFVIENYEGDWNVLALYSPGGNEQNIFSMGADDSALMPTKVMRSCPYFDELLCYFECPFVSVRLLRLGAGSVIKSHQDHALGYEDDVFRLHIPIITNPDVQFILDGDRLQMLPGECWYTNVNYFHSVSNLGVEDRVHLVIDGERNEWSDKLFFSLAPKASFFPIKEETHSKETWQATLKELEREDNEVNKMLIDDIRQRLREWVD